MSKLVKCSNLNKNQQKNNPCSNTVNTSLLDLNSVSLKTNSGELFFCSKKCREDFKKYYSLTTYHRNP